MDDRVLVLEMIAYIEENLQSDLTSGDLVEYSGYSLNRLRQKFFNVTGDTPSGYLKKRRLTEAAKEILSGEKILDVCLKYGYSSQENFTTTFRTYFGVTPKEIFTMDKKYKRFIANLREVFSIMEFTGLQQLQDSSTLMGCLRGAANYYDLDLSQAMFYGLSGFGFFINIHNQLCPSAPYVWNHEGFWNCVKDLGIEFVREFQYGKDVGKDVIEKAEKDLIADLNNGCLGILNYMEHQLVSGYDETGFQLLGPWNYSSPVELKQLSFSTWEECLESDDPFVCFTVIKKGIPEKDMRTLVKNALEYGIDQRRNPENHQVEGYKVGYGAYENWISCVKQGMGNGHPHWWNGMVWTEARKIGSMFFSELEEFFDDQDQKKISGELSQLYSTLGEHLDQIKEKELAADKQEQLLQECIGLEKDAEQKMEALAAAL